MKFKSKIKEVERKDATIKIKTILEVTENPKGSFKNKEKLISISIDKYYGVTSTCFPFTRDGRRRALKFISRECYL
jgi:hypothetical protein